MTPQEVAQRFKHIPPDERRVRMHVAARAIISDAAQQLTMLLKDSRELSLVMTKLEEAMFWANAGIARNVPDPEEPAMDPAEPNEYTEAG